MLKMSKNDFNRLLGNCKTKLKKDKIPIFYQTAFIQMIESLDKRISELENVKKT